MYEISVTSRFSGAHRLKGYDGPCCRVHGHNWDVEVFLKGNELDELGMLADFTKVKTALAEALSELDHRDLNEVAGLAGVNPTSENLARHFYHKLSKILNCGSYSVSKVRVSEAQGSSAWYWDELG